MRIIYPKPDGGVAIVIPTDEFLQDHTIEDLAARVVPPGVAHEIVDTVPTDRTFRNAWVKDGKTIQVHLDKAKLIAHDRRRAARAEEFAPHDEIIAKQIPGKSAQAAEAERAKIRVKYDLMQTAIDAAKTPDEIKAALGVNHD